jgi:hypothetical protein
MSSASARAGAVEILGDLAAPFLGTAVVEGAAEFGEPLRLGDADAEHVLAEARQEEGDQRLADDAEGLLDVMLGRDEQDSTSDWCAHSVSSTARNRCCLSGK